MRKPALLAAAVATLAVALPSTALAHPHAKEYKLEQHAVPNQTTGPDGALWGSDGSLNRLWRVTTKGKVSSIQLEGGAVGVRCPPRAPSPPTSSPAPTARSGSPSPTATRSAA